MEGDLETFRTLFASNKAPNMFVPPWVSCMMLSIRLVTHSASSQPFNWSLTVESTTAYLETVASNQVRYVKAWIGYQKRLMLHGDIRYHYTVNMQLDNYALVKDITSEGCTLYSIKIRIVISRDRSGKDTDKLYTNSSDSRAIQTSRAWNSTNFSRKRQLQCEQRLGWR